MARPRKYPDGTTAADRTRVALDRLRADGGARKAFDLSAEALESLATIRAIAGDRSDRALVERLLQEELARLNASK